MSPVSRKTLSMAAGVWFVWIMVRYLVFEYANIGMFLRQAPGVERVLSGLRSLVGG